LEDVYVFLLSDKGPLSFLKQRDSPQHDTVGKSQANAQKTVKG